MQHDFEKNQQLEDLKRKELIAQRRKKLEPYAPHFEEEFLQHKVNYLLEKEANSKHWTSVDGLEDIKNVAKKIDATPLMQKMKKQ